MTIIRRNGQWLAAEVGKELLMMSPAHENYIGLNEVGARIWALLETPTSMDALCAQLVREFEVEPAVAQAETQAFLDNLLKHDAIAFDPTEAA